MPSRPAKQALKSGRKAAVKKGVNDYASKGGSVQGFAAKSKSTDNQYKRALQGRGVPKGR